MSCRTPLIRLFQIPLHSLDLSTLEHLLLQQRKKDEIAQQQVDHNEEKQQYNACQAIEQALRKQIIDAIPAEHLDALRTPTRI